MKNISSFLEASNTLKNKGKKEKNHRILQRYFFIKPSHRGNILSQPRVKFILIGVMKSF